MPPTIHPHLKRGLDFDGYYADPGDTTENLGGGLEENQDPAEQAAKRRRIERIAAQYLQGRPPLILSARLKGPFNSGWKNPWKTHPQAETSCSGNSSHTVGGRKKSSGGPNVKSRKHVKQRSRITQEALSSHGTLRVPSPEASRASKVSYSIQSTYQDDSLNNIEVPQATAPSPVAEGGSMNVENPSGVQSQHQDDNFISIGPPPEEQERSCATPFFSANAKADSRRSSRTASSDNSWLKRAGQRERSRRTNNGSDLSPICTRSKDKSLQTSSRQYLQLQPHTTSHTMSAPAKTTGRSKVMPASIVTKVDQNETVRCTNPQKAAIKDASLVSPCAQPTTMAVIGSVECNSTNRETSDFKPSQTVPSSSSERRLTKQVIQQSAERLVGMMNPPSSSARQLRRTCREASLGTSKIRVPRHNLVASPAPASSTGFVYRKIETAKRTTNPRRKVRTVDFDKSPASRPNIIDPVAQSPKHINSRTMTGSNEEVPDKAATVTHYPENEEGVLEEPPDSDYYSTQAAMLLAQMEFQEDSFPSVMVSTLRHESEPQTDTPRPMLSERSAAITPFSVRLDKPISHQSVRQDMPMSTQELFGAASPFAFSTIKKQHGALQQSDLRRALFSGNDKHQSITTKSPTPSTERVPLKTKNTVTSRWSFVSGTASQASQESKDERPRRSMSEVELPRLDLDTSLGNFGRTVELDFMDGLMHNLHDT